MSAATLSGSYCPWTPGVQALLKSWCQGTRHFRNGLDQDPTILAEFERLGLGVRPSEYWEQVQGRSLADQSKLLLQSLTNNPMAGDKLAKFHWLVREREADEGAGR